MLTFARDTPHHAGALVNRPEIIAHRGASLERPENTLAAFIRAHEVGADAIELDVHLTADGVLVVHHDPVPGGAPRPDLARRPISTLTFEELSTFRVGGEPIPPLADVFTQVGSRMAINCELKGAGTAAPTLALIASAGTPAAVHAFDHRQVALARTLAPKVPRGVLEASYHIDPVVAMASVDARDLWQYWELIDEPLVRAAHARGGRVVAWTVDDPAAMRNLAALGVDALCTNDPALARSTFSP
jgi:glycerophosphoryl diester phosphodiesterase